jgi:hypothetical protein
MIKSNVKDSSFVKHTIGETLEAGWLVQIKKPSDFTTSELGYIDGKLGCPYMGIVLERLTDMATGGAVAEYWRILLPNGKKPIVTPDEVKLMAG